MLAILSQIITVENLLMMNVGIFAGIIIGAMPGLSVTFAVSVMLTLSVGLESAKDLIADFEQAFAVI